MFRPLAWTKTLAVGFSSLLAITLVPVLMLLFIRGRLRPESQNPISRITQAIYLPVLRLCLRFRKTTLAAQSALSGRHLAAGVQDRQPVHAAAVRRLGALHADRAAGNFDRRRRRSCCRSRTGSFARFPKWKPCSAPIGRSDSATDNAPLDMYDTTIMLKPREQWRPGMTYEKLIQEMDAKLQFPGLSNTWTMPVENRLDMELTGIKTPVGIEDSGTEPRRHSAGRRADSADSFDGLPERAIHLCGTRLAGLLHQHRSESRGGGALRTDRRRCAAGRHLRNRRRDGRRKYRRPRALSHQRPLQPRFSGQCRGTAARPDRHAIRRADSDRRSGQAFRFRAGRP